MAHHHSRQVAPYSQIFKWLNTLQPTPVKWNVGDEKVYNYKWNLFDQQLIKMSPTDGMILELDTESS